MNHAAVVDLWVTDHPAFDGTLIVSGILWCVLRGFGGILNYFFLTGTETSGIACAVLRGVKIVRLLQFFPFFRNVVQQKV